MKKLLFALTLVLVLATQSFALKAENVENGLSKLKDIDSAIAWLECILPKKDGDSRATMIGTAYSIVEYCSCTEKARKVLEDDGVYKMLLKEIETLKERRSSIKVEE